MIEQALRYQTEGDDWVKRIAIGGGLIFFSIFLIPIFTVYGYLLEVIRNAMRGDLEEPPAWGEYDLVDLTINGLKAFVILFAYSFVVSIVAWVPSTLLGAIGGALDLGILALLGTLVYFVLSLAGSLAVAVIAPVALGNFVLEEDISAGFDVNVLKNVATEMAMLRAVGLGIAIYLLTAIVSSVVSIFVITILIVPFIFFAGISGMALVWGQGFAEAYRDAFGDLPGIPDGPVDTVDETAVAEERTATSSEAESEAEDDGGPTTGEETGTDGGTAGSGDDPADDDRWEN